MNRYCTLFDSGYLTRGLALYRSMVRTGESFELYIFCFDDLAYEILGQLELPYVRLISLKEFETAELLAVKGGRSRAEYCWTSTPHVIRHVLKQFGANEVTYIDADLFFFAKPSILLEEFRAAGASVLLTEHRYAPAYDQSATSGRYCVQFMTFKADSRGQRALDWWAERCLEWCYARHEDGKFGDQKYLDDWLTRFEGVHVLRHLGGGVAPWNVSKYAVSTGPAVDGVPIVFYHFHALKWFRTGYFDLADGYQLPEGALRFVYEPYLAALKAVLSAVQEFRPGFDLGKAEAAKGLRPKFRSLKRMLTGRYHVLSE